MTTDRPTIVQIIPDLDTGGAELSAIEISNAIAVAGGRWQAGEPPQEQVEAAVEEAVDVVVGLVGLGGPSDS